MKTNAYFAPAKFNNRCRETGAPIKAGERIALDIERRMVFCSKSKFYQQLQDYLNELAEYRDCN